MKSAQYWAGYFDARMKDNDFDLDDVINIIVDIQNDATLGMVPSTPTAKKSGTPSQKTTKMLTCNPVYPTLTYKTSTEYTLYWKNQCKNFTAQAPNNNNYLSEEAEIKVIGYIIRIGFQAKEPMIWVRECQNKWVLQPKNEWKDDTTTGDIYSGNAD